MYLSNVFSILLINHLEATVLVNILSLHGYAKTQTSYKSLQMLVRKSCRFYFKILILMNSDSKTRAIREKGYNGSELAL